MDLIKTKDKYNKYFNVDLCIINYNAKSYSRTVFDLIRFEIKLVI